MPISRQENYFARFAKSKFLQGGDDFGQIESDATAAELVNRNSLGLDPALYGAR